MLDVRIFALLGSRTTHLVLDTLSLTRLGTSILPYHKKVDKTKKYDKLNYDREYNYSLEEDYYFDWAGGGPTPEPWFECSMSMQILNTNKGITVQDKLSLTLNKNDNSQLVEIPDRFSA
jgi:hypothetical protein